MAGVGGNTWGTKSLPTRERELKLRVEVFAHRAPFVAPYTGA